MTTEDQNRPRRDLKSLWLLLPLGAGLWVALASWKKPPSTHPPAGFGAAGQEKYEAYRRTKYLLLSRVGQGQPKGSAVISFAPYTDGIVTKMGPSRYRCSSSLTVRSRTGELLEERWQCIITGDRNNWACESFQHAPPEHVPPSRVGLGANTPDVQ